MRISPTLQMNEIFLVVTLKVFLQGYTHYLWPNPCLLGVLMDGELCIAIKISPS